MEAHPPSFYITTAIDYANGLPHLGHAYEKVLADAIHRTKKLEGYNSFFLTGLDEHGQKVQQSAQKAGQVTQDFCDGIAQHFQALCHRLNINYSRYARTTHPQHRVMVQKILQHLFDQGLIYKKAYEGFYSTTTEQFLQEKDRQIDGSWPKLYGDVQFIVEENYFFKLSAYQDWLEQYVQAHENWILPSFRRAQVLEFLKEPLNDLCISRPKTRLSWGIDLPFDDRFVTYVWFDALLNYVTFAQNDTFTHDQYWPAHVQVIGKDILVPAHAIYWPIMLHAAQLPLPKHILAHGWWTVKGEKMSKSVGNVVNPIDLIDIYGPDAFRYFLLRHMHVGQDADFSLELFAARYHNELGNDLGNLVSRWANMLMRYTHHTVPAVHHQQEPEYFLDGLLKKTIEHVPALYGDYQFSTGIDVLWELIRGLNKYAETRAPWKLAKSNQPHDINDLHTTLAYLTEGLRVVAICLQPIMPVISEKIANLLLNKPCLSWAALNEEAFSLEQVVLQLPQNVILFPKIETSTP